MCVHLCMVGIPIVTDVNTNVSAIQGMFGATTALCCDTILASSAPEPDAFILWWSQVAVHVGYRVLTSDHKSISIVRKITRWTVA